MHETMGRLLAAGNVAELFEWHGRVLKLYRAPAAKPVVFREAAIHAAVEALGLPVPAVWGVQQIGGRWGVVFDRMSLVSFAERMRDHLRSSPSIRRPCRVCTHGFTPMPCFQKDARI